MGTAVVDALTAAGITYRRTDFADPHLTGPTALTVTADGHVYGHLATWGTCHISFGDQCVTPGEVDLTLDGEPVTAPGTVAFRGAMLSGVPNFAFCVRYFNLSWTMRSDITARFVARVSCASTATSTPS